MKTIILSFITLSIFASSKFSPRFTCSNENFTLKIEDDQIILESSVYAHPITKKISQTSWDGHMTGLIQSDLTLISYKNGYGCIYDVTYTGKLYENSNHYGHIMFDHCKNLNGFCNTHSPRH